jgi:hypothetical protein
MFYPNRDKDKQWKVGTYPLEFKTTVIESENPDGTFNRYAETTVENNQMKETKGQSFKVKMEELKWEKFEQNEKQFFAWNPRVGFGGTFTTEDISPVLDFSFSSYGRTKRDMDWRFFTFGVGAHENADDDWVAQFSFEPFSWNLGNALPVIENLFVGPVVTVDTESDTGYGVKLSIPF